MSAAQERQDALARQSRAAGEADEVLADILGSAHATTVAALRRLDEIEATVEGVVRHQDSLALDTAAGARELQRVLLGMQQEIVTVVDNAIAEDAANKAVLEGLLTKYPSAAD